MTTFTKIASVTTLLALFGAGCAAQPASPTNEQAPQTQTSNTSPSGSSAAPSVGGASTTGSMTSSTVVIDDTWQTYTSKTLGFSFRWPTKGSYAPTWEVHQFNADDPEIKDGCDMGKDLPLSNAEKLTSGGVTFCHTSFVGAAAGNAYLTDAFATTIGKTVAVITLTKHVVSAGAMNCSFMNDYPYSTSAASCNPFKPDDYKAEYLAILSSFALGANP